MPVATNSLRDVLTDSSRSIRVDLLGRRWHCIAFARQLSCSIPDLWREDPGLYGRCHNAGDFAYSPGNWKKVSFSARYRPSFSKKTVAQPQSESQSLIK